MGKQSQQDSLSDQVSVYSPVQFYQHVNFQDSNFYYESQYLLDNKSQNSWDEDEQSKVRQKFEGNDEDNIPTDPIFDQQKIVPSIPDLNPHPNNEDITNIEIVIPIKKKNQIYSLPGETKNLPKNYIRAIKAFIQNNLDDEILQERDIQRFLKIDPSRAGNQLFKKLLKNSPLLKQLMKICFGQMTYCSEFLLESKVDLEPYIRHNYLWYNL